MGRPDANDIGLGALYFFSSHMVIRTMFYAGVGRTSAQMLAFFLVVLGAVCLVHVFWRAFLRLRVVASEYIEAPVVSVTAAVGALLVLLSIIPAVGWPALLIGGGLVGVSFAWMVVIWMSSFRVGSPSARTFAIPPALLWAVGFYFGFRAVSLASPTVSTGYLLALPLVTIACMAVEPPQRGDGPEGDEQEGGRSQLVLVAVSGAFAIGCAAVVHIAGMDGLVFDSAPTYQVLFEVIMVAVTVAICRGLARFCEEGARPAHAAQFVTASLCLPTFVIGVATGLVYVPESMASLMWETSFWVLLVAVFAYDMRATPYLVDGLGVGLMFESMCVGQALAQMATGGVGGVVSVVVSAALGAVYLASVSAQLLGAGAEAGTDAGAVGLAREAPGPAARLSGAPVSAGVLMEGFPTAGFPLGEVPGGASAVGALGSGQAPLAGQAPGQGRGPDLELGADARSARIGAAYGLTPSEVRILELVSRGWSARAISDELCVSFNTVRTHIKHVYEKLGIHSKQELIELVNKG